MASRLDPIKLYALAKSHRRVKILVVAILAIFLGLLPACGADSPLVYVFGKDIENFVDRTADQKESAKLKGEYLFLYLQKPDRFVERGSSEDKVRLFLKDSLTGQVETVFEGKLGTEIKYGFILPKAHIILFTLEDWRSKDDNMYMYTYNYQENVLLQQKIRIFEPKKYTNEPLWVGGGVFLDTVDLCLNNTSLCTRIKYGQNEKGYYCFDFNVIDIKTGVRKTIDEQTYRRLATESHMGSAVRYESVKNGKKIKLFSVYQYNDRIRENPKPKYNGIYINDGKNNIRISRLDGYELLKSKPVWVENDTKVIIGCYLLEKMSSF